MENKTIKKALTNSLSQIESEDFNAKILEKLHLKKSQKSLTVFNSKDMIITTVLVFITFISIITKIINNVDQTTLILSAILCLTPLFFMVFNKIHQLTINQN